MRVVLGWHFDDGAWPDMLQGQKHSQGVRVVGPGGFLGILENRLGLPTPVTNAGVRMARMYGAMRAAKDSSAFYAKSFALDPWPTAERVLAMRDELVLAGWKRTSDLPRLKALAVLDADFLAPGFSDRLHCVREALAQNAPTGLREVTLVQHEAQERQWPAPWADIFAGLARCGVQITHQYAPAPGDSDLGKIAQALATQSSCSLAGDGSLKIVRAGTRLEAAARLPELMREVQDGGGVLIRDSGDLLLDATLQAHGFPLTGCTAVSTARAAASLVRLFLQVRLLPFDAGTWYDFLQLPISPIPRFAASRLASALGKSPCLGQQWATAVADLAARPEKAFAVNDWLPSCTTSGQTSIAANTVLAVLGILEQWSSERVHLGREDEASRRAFHAAVRSLCRDCAVAVKALAETTLSPILLQRLLDGVLGSGLEAAHTACEPAPWRTLTHPGQIWGPVQSVLWWAFQTATPASSNFWTAEEQTALAAEGVQLPDSAIRSRMEAAAWLAPLRFARQVTLVLPEREGTEPAIPHPLFDALRAVLSDAALDALATPPQKSSTATVAWTPSRALHPSAAPLPPPDRVSVTALSDLLQCPFKFYAEKQLGLTSQLRALPRQELILGNLGHAIMEALLTDPDFGTAADMASLCEEKLRTLPEAHALAGDVLSVFLRAMASAAESLRDIMNTRGLRYVEAEAFLSGPLSKTPLILCEGRLDLRFTDAGGKNVILDMKWTKSSSRYDELLKNNKDAQLAAYAGLDGNTVDAGYFLLRNGHVFWHEDHTPLAERWQAIRDEVSGILQEWKQGSLGLKRSDSACKYCELRVLCGEAS